MTRVLVTLAMLAMLPWQLVRAWVLSTVGVVSIVSSAIGRQWR